VIFNKQANNAGAIRTRVLGKRGDRMIRIAV